MKIILLQDEKKLGKRETLLKPVKDMQETISFPRK